MYLTVIIGLFNIKAVGWSMSDNLTKENKIIVRAWNKSIRNMNKCPYFLYLKLAIFFISILKFITLINGDLNYRVLFETINIIIT